MKAAIPIKTLSVACQLVLVGCANVFEYTPPAERSIPQNQVTVSAPFDTVWTELIERVGAEFFAIDNFEKESGLLTLSFSAAPISAAVDGGECKITYDDSFAAGMNGQPATYIRFAGNYSDYLTQYHHGQHTGRANLVVRAIDSDSTRVTVNVRHVVTADSHKFQIEGTQRYGPIAIRNGKVQVFLQPTGVVEDRILSVLKSID